VEEGDDGLAQRHALDREEAVPAGVQLVDDDVRVALPLERLRVVEPFDDAQLAVELRARKDDVVGALAPPGRGSVDDDGTAATGRPRGRHSGAGGAPRGERR